MFSRRPTGGRGNRRGVGGGVARVPIFPLGDSLTLGFSGAGGADNAGGWRVHVRAPAQFTGPYSDFGKHAGVNGDKLANMSARFAADYSGNESNEIWVLGAANDVNVGLSAVQAATALGTLLDTIYGVVAATKVVRVFTCPYLEYAVAAKNTVLDEYDRRIAQVVAANRAAGRAVYVHDVGDPIQTNAHLDGVNSGGLEHPINGVYGDIGVGTGYAFMANRLDRYLLAQPATTPASSFGGLTLEAWYRADDITGSQLNDRSGNGRHVTLFNSPTQSAGINGAAKLTFNGTNQYGRSGTGWTIAQPNTVLHICKPTAVTGGPALFDAATTTARCAMICSAINQIQMFAGTLVSDALLAPTTIVHAYLGTFDNTGGSTLDVDSVPRRQTIACGAQGMNGITLAASSSASPSNFMAGDWYETVIFSGRPTNQDVAFALLGGYVNARYGFWPLLGGSTLW